MPYFKRNRMAEAQNDHKAKIFKPSKHDQENNLNYEEKAEETFLSKKKKFGTQIIET